MADSGNKASGDAGACGYPAATTGKPCRRRPLAGRQRCLEHADKPGAPKGNTNTVTHGAYRDPDRILADMTDEERGIFDAAPVGRFSERSARAIWVELHRFLARTSEPNDRLQGLLAFADRLSALDKRQAEVAALLAKVRGGGEGGPEGSADDDVAALIRGAQGSA